MPPPLTPLLSLIVAAAWFGCLCFFVNNTSKKKEKSGIFILPSTMLIYTSVHMYLRLFAAYVCTTLVLVFFFWGLNESPNGDWRLGRLTHESIFRLAVLSCVLLLAGGGPWWGLLVEVFYLDGFKDFISCLRAFFFFGMWFLQCFGWVELVWKALSKK